MRQGAKKRQGIGARMIDLVVNGRHGACSKFGSAFHKTGVGHRARWHPMTPRPPVDDSTYLAMALQVARHFWQASAHFLQQGMSPHFKHSAAQFSHALAHSPHIAPESGASYSINATHARHVSKHVRQCFSQLGQSQLTRHSRHARRHSLQAVMQFSLSTGSSVVSAADVGSTNTDAIKIKVAKEVKTDLIVVNTPCVIGNKTATADQLLVVEAIDHKPGVEAIWVR